MSVLDLYIWVFWYTIMCVQYCHVFFEFSGHVLYKWHSFIRLQMVGMYSKQSTGNIKHTRLGDLNTSCFKNYGVRFICKKKLQNKRNSPKRQKKNTVVILCHPLPCLF